MKRSQFYVLGTIVLAGGLMYLLWPSPTSQSESPVPTASRPSKSRAIEPNSPTPIPATPLSAAPSALAHPNQWPARSLPTPTFTPDERRGQMANLFQKQHQETEHFITQELDSNPEIIPEFRDLLSQRNRAVMEIAVGRPTEESPEKTVSLADQRLSQLIGTEKFERLKSLLDAQGQEREGAIRQFKQGAEERRQEFERTHPNARRPRR